MELGWQSVVSAACKYSFLIQSFNKLPAWGNRKVALML